MTEPDDIKYETPKLDVSDGRHAARTASSALPSADEIADRDFGSHLPKLNVFTLGIGFVVAASFGIWVYAYSGAANRPPPDILETRAFAEAAEPICAQALTDLEEIPDASLAASAAERSVELRAATQRLDDMINKLANVTVANESVRDAELRAEWTTNWRIYIADRYRFADALLVDDQARFLISDVGVSESPEKRLTRFAIVNKMKSCGTPGDAG